MAEENETQELEKAQEAPAKGGGGNGKNPLLTVLLLLNTGIMGFVAFQMMEIHKKTSAEVRVADIAKAVDKHNQEEFEKSSETGEAIEEDGILFPLNPFTANLAQGDGPRRFVRMNAVLKFSKKSKEEEFKARKPQIRDVIISTLNSKRPEDLLKVEGKSFLKEEIKNAINTFLVDGEVIDIYYVGFQVN